MSLRLFSPAVECRATPVCGFFIAISALLILTLGPVGSARAQTVNKQLTIDGISVDYPPGWIAKTHPSVSMLSKLPPGASALPTDPAQLADLPQIVISTETRRNHAGAVRRLYHLSGTRGVAAHALEIGGWPAIQVQFQTARVQPSQGDLLGSDTVLIVRTAVAAGNTLLRLEAQLPPDADKALIAEVLAIGMGLQFASRGDPASAQPQVQRLQKSIEVKKSLAPPPPASLQKNGGAADGGGAAEVQAAAGAGAGASVPVATGDNFPDAELEIAVSGNGRDLVIGSNRTWYYSDDAGQTWTSTTVTGNDPSVAWGQSGGSQGTFYAANINLSAGSTSIQVSTDGGANWTAATTAYTCGQNGDVNDCFQFQGTGFPDQEHIAVDRWNLAAGGDQIYSTWHNAGGGMGRNVAIVCSADSANTWSANRYVIGLGSFPRITVGADGFVYVVYVDLNTSNIMLDKFAPCETQGNQMANVSAVDFPVMVRENYIDVVCPMPGLNRCNNGNVLVSPTVAVDDTNPSHIYVAYANNSNPGDGSNCVNQNLCNDNVIVQDSLDGGLTWPASGDPTDTCVAGSCTISGDVCAVNADCFDGHRSVTVSSGVTARRFMPWVCAVGGNAYVSWFDRRAAFPGSASDTTSNNSLTDYFAASAFLDPLGALKAGPEFQINEPGTSDPQCEAGFVKGSGNSWPNGTRNMSDSDSCSAQPQNAGFCCDPSEIVNGRCQPGNPPVSSQNSCDFDNSPGSVACPGAEQCVTALGFPKYGDYNGNVCGIGRFYTTWPSSVAPAGLPATSGIDSFFSSKIVCCVAQIQVPGSADFGEVCGAGVQTVELQVCNTGKEDLEVGSIDSSDSQFAVSAPSSGFPVTISPDFCFPFEATFTSDGSGDASGTLTINNNDPVNPAVEVAVTASVGEPDINVAIANSGQFGNACQGEHADLDVTLFNQGSCNLTISDISLLPDAGSFELPADLQLPLVLSPDADFRFPVRFAPDSCNDAPEERTVVITSDDPDESTVNVDVSGVSECPNLVIDPVALENLYSFPATVVDSTGSLGCFSERSVVLRNNSVCPLTITDITTSGPDFAVVAPTVFPIILPGGEETLQTTVRFAPQSDADPLAPSELVDVLVVSSNDPDFTNNAALCGESAQQSGVRILVTDVSSGIPGIVGEVDSLTVQSKGKGKPGPVNLMFSNLAPSSANVCGQTIDYHVNLETLPSTSTTGSNPNSSYQAKAREGNLQTSDSFGLAQCEFRDAQLQLQDSDSPMCLLLPKGDSCTLDSECCSGNCKGPSGGKSCK